MDRVTGGGNQDLISVASHLKHANKSIYLGAQGFRLVPYMIFNQIVGYSRRDTRKRIEMNGQFRTVTLYPHLDDVFNAEKLKLVVHMIRRNSLSLSKYSPFCRRDAKITRFASTRSLQTPDDVEPRLPRFIRRQHLQEAYTKTLSPSLSPKVTPTHRSRYHDPSNQVPASTRSLPTPDYVEPRLPRFIRRQHLQEASTKTLSPSLSPKVTPTHRSRYYDPSNQVPKADKRLLEPHVLSGRLKKLCDSNKVDDAVYMLKNAPLDAQNTQVWNTLIWGTLKVKRFQLSYELFVDVNMFLCFFH